MKQAQRLTTLLALACPLAFGAPPDCASNPQVALDKIAARALLVGELHGNAQTPALVGQLACGLLQLGRPVIVALERDGREQQALNRYLDSAGTPADTQALLAQGAWAQPVQDGRNSQAMLALIEQLRRWRQAGQRVGVLAMQLDWSEVAPRDGTARQPLSEADMAYLSEMNDRAMADKVWATLISYPGYTVVALAGNTHTALGSPSRLKWVPSPSFADALALRLPVHVIGVGSQGGSSWNMTPEGTGAHPVMRGPLFNTDSRIDTRVDLGPLTASPPAGGTAQGLGR